MATIRVGFGSDFKVSDSKIGIGTANPTALLEVSETAKADFNITGVTTLTSYGGFIAQNQYVNKPTTINSETTSVGTFQQYYETETGFTDLGGVHHGDDQRFNTLSEDLVIDDGQILNITSIDMVGATTIGEQDPHSHSSYVCAGSLEQVSITGHFSVPNGGTNERKGNPIEGTVRFNTDLNTLEFFNGNEWRQFTYNQGQSGRAVTGAGYDNPGYTYTIDYVNIATRGNSAYFGDLSNSTASQNYNYAACSSSIRGLFGGGANQPGSAVTDVISYITIAAGGNCIDFGNLTDARTFCRGFSSSTRALFGGGYDPSNSNIVDYVEIGTLGNALDFGNLSVVASQKMACSSPTRGLFAGGGPTYIAAIDSFQIATLGDAQDFGDLTQKRGGGGGCSNATRGVFMGGEMSTPSTVRVDTIDFVSISSFGNAIDFGNLSSSRAYSGATSNSVRGLALGGIPMTNSIEYISISTAGNAEDFGDLVVPRYGVQSLSDSHGGLGGF